MTVVTVDYHDSPSIATGKSIPVESNLTHLNKVQHTQAEKHIIKAESVASLPCPKTAPCMTEWMYVRSWWPGGLEICSKKIYPVHGYRSILSIRNVLRPLYNHFVGSFGWVRF